MPDRKEGEPIPKRPRVHVENPKHVGIQEAKKSGAATSRRVAEGLAKHGSPHHTEVATDDRLRKAEREKQKMDDFFASRHRLLDPTLK